MKYLVPAMMLLLAACASDEGAPDVALPPIPAPPQLDAASCYNLNNYVYQVEQGKKASGHYGKGEEKRLEMLRSYALLGGCFLDPDFVPAPAPVNPTA